MLRVGSLTFAEQEFQKEVIQKTEGKKLSQKYQNVQQLKEIKV